MPPRQHKGRANAPVEDHVNEHDTLPPPTLPPPNDPIGPEVPAPESGGSATTAPEEAQDLGVEEQVIDQENSDIPEDSAHATNAESSSATLSGNSDSLAVMTEILVQHSEAIKELLSSRKAHYPDTQLKPKASQVFGFKWDGKTTSYAEYIRRVREALPSIPPNNPQMLFHLIRNTLEEPFRSAFTLAPDDWKDHEIVICRLNTACGIGPDMTEVFAHQAFFYHAINGDPAHSSTLLKWTEHLLMLRDIQPISYPDKAIITTIWARAFTAYKFTGYDLISGWLHDHRAASVAEFMDMLRSLNISGNTTGLKRTRDDDVSSVTQWVSKKHFRKQRGSRQHGSTPPLLALPAPPTLGGQMSDASKGNPSKAYQQRFQQQRGNKGKWKDQAKKPQQPTAVNVIHKSDNSLVSKSFDFSVRSANEYPSRKELWLVPIILDLPHQLSVDALIDSGSQLNAIHPVLVARLGLQTSVSTVYEPFLGPPEVVTAGVTVDGRPVRASPVEGHVTLNFTISGIKTAAKFGVIPLSYPFILGQPWLSSDP
jgi:hypothetical protein